MQINREAANAIRVELSNMQKAVKAAEDKMDENPPRYEGHKPNINGTQESMLLQAQFKVMKYNIGKLFK